MTHRRASQMLTFLLIAAAALAAGCSFGPDPAALEAAASSGRGAMISVNLRRGDGPTVIVRGELLAAEPQGLLVLRESDMARVRWMDIDRAELEPSVPEGSFGRNVAADEPRRRRIAAVSRFPQGISPEMLRTLSEHYGPVRPVSRDEERSS
jgi:hypothetical protein